MGGLKPFDDHSTHVKSWVGWWSSQYLVW